MNLEIQLFKKELRTDSRLLATHLNHRHRTILENIDKYESIFLEFGRLPFETGAIETRGGVQMQRYALLNEDQCYFLLTLMRNNAKILRAKANLVKAFSDARKQLAERDLARIKGKQVRRLETDSIEKLVDYAAAKGSKNASMYYTNITKMTNKILGIEAGQRDTLTSEKLQQITAVETIVNLAIRDGLKAELHYQDIYRLAKERALAVLPALGKL